MSSTQHLTHIRLLLGGGLTQILAAIVAQRDAIIVSY